MLVAGRGSVEAALRPLRSACRNFSVISDDDLPRVFEDDPLAAAGEVP
jgi:hypothetical protein